jgi:hypothetical protein
LRIGDCKFGGRDARRRQAGCLCYKQNAGCRSCDRHPAFVYFSKREKLRS